MNAILLQDKLVENPDYIIKILEDLDFNHIRDRGKYIQFPNHSGDNLGACSILKSNLVYQNFSHPIKGNLFTLVMSEKNLNFPMALKWIANSIGISHSELNQKTRLPFKGFFHGLLKTIDEPETSLPTYPESIIEPYYGFNMMWYEDGVDFETQEKFHLGYDLETNSILIPIYNVNGKLVGVKARKNDTKCLLSERWWAWIPFSKTSVLYGYHENYKNIIEKDLCIIEESEKGVQQMSSFGCYIGLSVLGHDISAIQSKYIKSLKTSRIIIAFDESLDEQDIRDQCDKLLIDNKIFHNEVYYIYDKKHEFLEIGSKDSPSDNGKEVFNKLIKHCLIKYERLVIE